MLILVVDQPVLQAFLLLNHTGKGVCIVYNLLIYANSYKKLKQINPSQNREKKYTSGPTGSSVGGQTNDCTS